MASAIACRGRHRRARARARAWRRPCRCGSRRCFAPGATPVVSPARSPGCAIAVPLLLMRAPTVSCDALDKRHARRHRHAVVERERERQVFDLARAGRRAACGCRWRPGEDEHRVARRRLRGERRIERDRAADAGARAARLARRSPAAAAAATATPLAPMSRGAVAPRACSRASAMHRLHARRELAAGRQLVGDLLPVGDRDRVVAAVEGGAAGERKRLVMLRVGLQRALDQRHRLRVVRGLPGSPRRRRRSRRAAEALFGSQLGGARIGGNRLVEAAEDGVRARQHGPALDIVGVGLHPLGELADHRLDLLQAGLRARTGAGRFGRGGAGDRRAPRTQRGRAGLPVADAGERDDEHRQQRDQGARRTRRRRVLAGEQALADLALDRRRASS